MHPAIMRLWGLLLLALFATGALAQATDAEAINLAGQQRMLSQRIVKSWVQIGLNVEPAMSKRQLDDAIRRFEQNLRVLEPMVNSAEARNALGRLHLAWAPLRGAVGGVIRQSDASGVDARGEDVLAAAEALTRVLQDQARVPASRWVNLAGRQRMLSQRLVKIYMLRQWGVDSARLRDELESVQNEFAGALSSLQQRAGNSPAIAEELDRLGLQWEWLRTALATEGAESFRLILAESGDAVTDLANEVTRLYQQP